MCPRRCDLRLHSTGACRARLAATAAPQAMLFGLQLLDEVATGLVKVGVDEVEVDAHAECHGHGEALLELDAVFAVATATVRCRSGRAAVPLTGLVA